ncbi:alpha-galactosidase [Vibrio mangrovi]|uniref:Alpha-galactosidase n=1 Tax=Vibrio mangrovi TaxID=474394 RepID=A0A1Y6IT11_9VIBR|nr:alpha-galactosidase [Vibrio mangrovi]MDW6004478.1 alpha-galactosidase [Vibrio mangrovi]SMS00766.1 Alpha-galactosidase [Vibrio mangrovi]
MQERKLIELTGKQTQLIIEVGEFAEILHWGNKVSGDLDRCRSALYRPVPQGRLDKDVSVTLSPELGRGLFSSPGLEGHRNGQDWAPVFVLKNIEQSDHKLSLESEDPQAGLCLSTEIQLDEYDVVKTRHTVTNTKSGQYQINRFANTLPLPAKAKELMTFYGRWVKEFQTQRQPLLHGGYQQENRRGRTSHEHYPALVAGSQNFSEIVGDVWGFHFAWSGNHRLRADVKADGRRYMQAEVIYLPGEVVLEEGESLTTPWLYASYSDRGLNGMSQQFHAHVRNSVISPDFTSKVRPVHLNTWEGIYFDHDPEYIMSMATQAAELGVERFIIDDGWFKARDDDTAALGDWFLDETKYPNGLEPVIAHVNRLGMEFGLWFEPEMINKDSDLYRAHPDWLLAVDGYEQPTGRNQYVIDLQNNDAFDYLYERLSHFLGQYNIAYIKWDMNREIVQPGHEGRASGVRQTERFYDLVDKLRTQFPHVSIESCASGGGRIDYEILKRTDRFWPSDNNDALERQHIQRGMSYFFPPEVMGSHIGSGHCHCSRRRHSIEFRGLTALFGHMGIELDPVKEDVTEKENFARYVALHKSIRPLLHSGTNWRIPTDDEAHQVQAVVSEDQSEAVVLVAQLAMPTNSLSGHLRIPGLNDQATYRVSVLDKPSFYEKIVNTQPSWTASGCEVSGSWCREVGIVLPVLDPETAMLIKLERIN